MRCLLQKSTRACGSPDEARTRRLAMANTNPATFPTTGGDEVKRFDASAKNKEFGTRKEFFTFLRHFNRNFRSFRFATFFFAMMAGFVVGAFTGVFFAPQFFRFF